MNCWILTVGEPVPDLDGTAPRLLRSAMLARTLVARGHSVVWWTSSFDHYRRVQRTDRDAIVEWAGVSIRLLRSVGYSRNVSLRRFLEHRGVARKFRRSSRTDPPPDVIVASLPTIELAWEGVAYGDRLSIPVLVDVRDLWPDLLTTVLPGPLRGLSRALLAPMYARARRALRGATGITAVSEQYLAWALERAGRERRDEDGVFPLAYEKTLEDVPGSAESAARLGRMGVDRSKKILLYVGSFGRQYDLAPVLEAARALESAQGTEPGSPMDFQLVIAGDGEMAPRWRGLAEGARSVCFTGWLQAPEIGLLLRAAAVGVMPYSEEATQGLPNKLFEYMSAGLPVLSSLRGECERLLESVGCGITYRAGDAADFRAKLLTMLSDPARLAAVGESGRRAFEREFDAAAVLSKMADHIENIAEEGR